MSNKVSTEQKPVPMRVKIMHLERSIIDRQRDLLNKGDAIGHNMRARLTSPKILLTAAAAGILLGFVTSRNASASKSHNKSARKTKVPDRRREHTEHESFVARFLKVMAMTRAFLAAWPPGWLNTLPVLGRGRAAAPVAPTSGHSPSTHPNTSIHPAGNPNQIH